jgi:hypothetical protein
MWVCCLVCCGRGCSAGDASTWLEAARESLPTAGSTAALGSSRLRLWLFRGCGCLAVAVAAVVAPRLRFQPIMVVICAVPVERPLKPRMRLLCVDTEHLKVAARMRRAEPSRRSVQSNYSAFCGGTAQQRLNFIVDNITSRPVLVQRVVEQLHAKVAEMNAERRREVRPRSTPGQLVRQRQRMAQLRARRKAQPVPAVAGV